MFAEVITYFRKTIFEKVNNVRMLSDQVREAISLTTKTIFSQVSSITDDLRFTLSVVF